MLAMRRDDGAVTGVIVAMQDVTRLRLMDEIKTNHLATLSHELKTPLTSLQLALELLGEDKGNNLTTRQQEIVGSARSDAERLVERLHDLLDLSKFQATGGAAAQSAGNVPDTHRRPSLGRRLTTRIVSLRDSERHG
jgi:NtrC-family two-component system sensor histidine kinase KinB